MNKYSSDFMNSCIRIFLSNYLLIRSKPLLFGVCEFPFLGKETLAVRKKIQKFFSQFPVLKLEMFVRKTFVRKTFVRKTFVRKTFVRKTFGKCLCVKRLYVKCLYRKCLYRKYLYRKRL